MEQRLPSSAVSHDGLGRFEVEVIRSNIEDNGVGNPLRTPFLRESPPSKDELNGLVGIGAILRARGENEKAAESFAHAALVGPMDDSLHFRLAQIYRDVRRKADAQQQMVLFMKTRDLKGGASSAQEQRTSH